MTESSRRTFPRALPALAIALICGAAACRTSGTSTVKDDTPAGGGASLYCKFTSPLTPGESFEVWAANGAGQLSGVKVRYATAKDPGQQTDSAATPVTLDAMTQSGARGIRSWSKAVPVLDPAAADCYAVAGGDGQTPNYFCLDKAPSDDGQVYADWVTQIAHQRYASDLTYYRANCGAGDAPTAPADPAADAASH